MNPKTAFPALTAEEWTGYGGVGDYAASNGNTYPVVMAGHQIRDHAFDPKAQVTDLGEFYDCVVVGGGISGLSAALFFARKTGGKKTCLVLENHPVVGGEAKRNEFEVDGQRLIAHQGSAACFPPLAGSFLASFYDSVGIRWPNFKYQQWSGSQPALKLETAPYPVGGPTSGLFFQNGQWLIDPLGQTSCRCAYFRTSSPRIAQHARCRSQTFLGASLPAESSRRPSLTPSRTASRSSSTSSRPTA